MTAKQSQHRSSDSMANKIMERIEDEKITPVPRWRFSARNGLFWSLWVLSVLVGAVAVSAAIFSLANSGYKYYVATHSGFVSFVFDTIPYLWLLLLTLFIIVALENLKHTKRGYKIPITLLLLVSILASLFFGFLIYLLGFAPVIDKTAGSLPFHETVQEHQMKIWNNPEFGLLAGEITSVDPELTSFTITTFEGEQWQILTDELRLQNMEILSLENEIRIVGVPDSENDDTFIACFIFPWSIAGMPGHRHPEGKAKIDCEHECEIYPDPPRSTKCKDVRPYEFFTKSHKQNINE